MGPLYEQQILLITVPTTLSFAICLAAKYAFPKVLHHAWRSIFAFLTRKFVDVSKRIANFSYFSLFLFIKPVDRRYNKLYSYNLWNWTTYWPVGPIFVIWQILAKLEKGPRNEYTVGKLFQNFTVSRVTFLSYGCFAYTSLFLSQRVVNPFSKLLLKHPKPPETTTASWRYDILLAGCVIFVRTRTIFYGHTSLFITYKNDVGSGLNREERFSLHCGSSRNKYIFILTHSAVQTILNECLM